MIPVTHCPLSYHETKRAVTIVNVADIRSTYFWIFNSVSIHLGAADTFSRLLLFESLNHDDSRLRKMLGPVRTL